MINRFEATADSVGCQRLVSDELMDCSFWQLQTEAIRSTRSHRCHCSPAALL